MIVAIDIDLQNQLIEVSDISHESSIGQTENFYVKYDKVILAMGSTTATHGVPGLENCFQLKTISDAQKIRRKILENLEQANLPSVDEKERKRLLSFVIAGGGPTGVEVAAELYDLFDEEIVESFPKLLREDLSISIIQSRSHLLNQYSEKISEYCEVSFFSSITLD